MFFCEGETGLACGVSMLPFGYGRWHFCRQGCHTATHVIAILEGATLATHCGWRGCILSMPSFCECCLAIRCQGSLGSHFASVDSLPVNVATCQGCLLWQCSLWAMATFARGSLRWQGENGSAGIVPTIYGFLTCLPRPLDHRASLQIRIHGLVLSLPRWQD